MEDILPKKFSMFIISKFFSNSIDVLFNSNPLQVEVLCYRITGLYNN
jgi:hypothetical protein